MRIWILEYSQIKIREYSRIFGNIRERSGIFGKIFVAGTVCVKWVVVFMGVRIISPSGALKYKQPVFVFANSVENVTLLISQVNLICFVTDIMN